MAILIPPEAQTILNDPKTLLILSISGGKDSDSMVFLTLQYQWQCQIELLHCDLGRMEWHNTTAYVENFAQRVNLPLNVIRYEHGDLLDAIRARMRKRPDVVVSNVTSEWNTGKFRKINALKVVKFQRNVGKTGSL